MSVAGERGVEEADGAVGLRTARPSRFAWTDAAAFLRRQIGVESDARSAFFLGPLGLLCGIALFYGADLRLPAAPTAVLAAALLSGAAWSAGRPVLQGLLVIIGFALFGLLLAHAELARTTTTHFSGEATVRIEGRVAWRDVDDRGQYRYLVDIARTERPVLSRPPERARIVVGSGHEPIPIGGSYRGLVRLRPPSGPALPGAHDFAFAPFFQGLGAYGYSLGAPEPSPPFDQRTLTFTERVADLRVAMAARIRATVPGAEGAVASALITGERAGIPEEVDEWLRATGLAHVLSISGFHMALVAGFTMFLVRAGAAAIPALALHHSTKKIAAAAALTVSTGYLLLAGDNVATERSWIMLVIMLGAILLDRPALTLRNVAVAAVVVATLSPHAVVTASFQMSFAATAALVGAAGALMRWWGRRRIADPGSRRPVLAIALAAVAGVALSSIVAGTATAPFGIYHFQRTALLGGVLANLVTMPLFSFWVMPLGLLAVVAMPFGLDAPLLQAMGLGLGLVFDLARALAATVPDHSTGPMSATGLVLFTVAIGAFCFLASHLRWVAVPIALIGFVLATPREAPPDLLIFEDGKEVALIDPDGMLHHMRARPSDFVDEQWRRAFPPLTDGDEPVGPIAVEAAAVGTIDERLDAFEPFVCEGDICRATTRSGLTVAWTENYELTGELCDTADITIVSRAIRLTSCRSGAELVTLRTLRRTGSLAIAADSQTGTPVVRTSIDTMPREWNAHRHAPWPEYWENPNNDRSSEGEIRKPEAPGGPSRVADEQPPAL